MGVQNDKTLVLDCFLSWKYDFKNSKQAWAHSLAQSKVVGKYGNFLMRQFTLQDDSALLTACFWEMLRAAHRQKAEREREQAHITKQELEMSLTKLREDQVN